MKSTKLEEYLTLLQILLSHGPIQITEIESFVSLKRIALRKDLAFLLEQKVIEKNSSSTTPAYIISPLGLRLIKYFNVNTVLKKHPE
jgi:predicted transcriptional regulator